LGRGENGRAGRTTKDWANKSVKVIRNVQQPHNHYGGRIAFASDGYFYIGGQKSGR
jgi:glucose/arabinose dehydrogenase